MAYCPRSALEIKYPRNIRSHCQLKAASICAVLNHPRNVEKSENLDRESAGRYPARTYEISVVATEPDKLAAAMAQYPPPRNTTETASAEAASFPSTSAANP